METAIHLDRLAMRGRPPGQPVLSQRWENLLFLHWPISPHILAPLIPNGLEIDTFDQMAWIGITPFAATHSHVGPLPEVPGLNSFDELIVRTYVYRHEKPGIYFLSLDASRFVMASAARLFFGLPYHNAEIQYIDDGQNFRFDLRRTERPQARFNALWRAGLRLQAPDLESLAFFLVERYCFYTEEVRRLYCARVYHAPWMLDEAVVTTCNSSLFTSLGLPEPSAPPIAYFSHSRDVEIWAPERV